MPDLQTLLDQIDRLDQEASEAPWQQDRTEYPTGDVYVEAGSERMQRKMERIDPDIGCMYAADAEFIALARDALPTLAKAVREVKAIVALVREHYTDDHVADLIALTIADDIDHAIYDAMNGADQ